MGQVVRNHAVFRILLLISSLPICSYLFKRNSFLEVSRDDESPKAVPCTHPLWSRTYCFAEREVIGEHVCTPPSPSTTVTPASLLQCVSSQPLQSSVSRDSLSSFAICVSLFLFAASLREQFPLAVLFPSSDSLQQWITSLVCKEQWVTSWNL